MSQRKVTCSTPKQSTLAASVQLSPPASPRGYRLYIGKVAQFHDYLSRCSDMFHYVVGLN
jgi:hypothetical protein